VQLALRLEAALYAAERATGARLLYGPPAPVGRCLPAIDALPVLLDALPASSAAAPTVTVTTTTTTTTDDRDDRDNSDDDNDDDNGWAFVAVKKAASQRSQKQRRKAQRLHALLAAHDAPFRALDLEVPQCRTDALTMAAAILYSMKAGLEVRSFCGVSGGARGLIADAPLCRS